MSTLHMSAPADPPNLGILIKLMKMTTSSHDGEALVAIRKANEALTKFGGDWEALLKGKVTVIGDPFVGISAPPSERKEPPPPMRAKPAPTVPKGQPGPSNSYAAVKAALRTTFPPKPQVRQPFVPQTGDRVIKNYFAGDCIHCRVPVATAAGFAIKRSGAKSWLLECYDCHKFGPQAPYSTPVSSL